MRLALIGQKGYPSSWGGVEVHVENIARGLAARGHDVLVFNRSWYAAEGQAGLQGLGLPRVVTTPALHTKSLDALSHSLTSSVAALGASVDVVHYHCMGPSLMAWLPRLLGRRVVCTIHGFDYRAAKWGLLARSALRLGEWTAFHAAHRTLVVAEHMQGYYEQRGRSSVCVPNGVEAIAYEPVSTLPKAWGLTVRGYLLFMGRLDDNKGAHLLVEAFRRCQSAGGFRGRRLVVAGDEAFETRYGRQLKASCGTDVLFTGSVEGAVKRSLLCNALAFVSPSRFEGMPITLLEAMSARTPVVVSDIPAHEELVQHGESGILCDCSTPEPLSAGLMALHAMGETELRAMCEAARAVADRYTWQRTVHSLERVYEAVVARVPASAALRVRQ